jgi:hypothetical protein
MSRSGRTARTLLLGIAPVVALAAPPTADPAELLRRADAPHDAFTEGVIRLKVVVNERGKPPAAHELELFVKGTDRSLLIFREGKQKGRKILTQGDNVFLIVPNTARPVPVSKTQRLMGAASFGDIARLRLADEYEATLRPDEETITESSGATRCRLLALTAKRKGVAYPKATLWLAAADGLPRRLRLALASGKDAKDVAFFRYDDQHRVAKMEIRDLLGADRANVTQLEFLSYEKRPVDPALFEPEGARAAP